MKKQLRWLLWVLVGVLALVGWSAAPAQEEGNPVLVLTADGPLTPAMAEYLQRVLRLAVGQ